MFLRSATPATQNDMSTSSDTFFATFLICTATFTLRSTKINVFLRVFLWTYCKIDVSCEASDDFHDMSQNATPATRQKSHVFATFPIGTATLRTRRPQTDGCERLRTVADACGRQKQGHANTGQPPDPHM